MGSAKEIGKMLGSLMQTNATKMRFFSHVFSSPLGDVDSMAESSRLYEERPRLE